MLRILLATLALASTAAPAWAFQLGESKTQLQKRYGVPGAEDRSKGVAIYFWDGWSAEVEYKEEAVSKLIYRRNTYLEQAEVVALLQSNGGFARWREATPAGDQTRQWVRDDGAIATCLALRPLMMTFQMGLRAAPPAARYSNHDAPKVVVPAATPVVSTTPPKFPKLLGSGADNETEPAQEPASTATPLSPVRSLPKLKSEEIGVPSETPSANAGESAAKEPSPEEERAARVRANRLRDEPAKLPADSGGHGLILSLLATLATAAGLAVYWFKFRTAHIEAATIPVADLLSRRSSPARSESIPAGSLANNPVIDALRNDQYELLVGEIFRREGYAVELSAAAAQGDSIDLTLRRDSETILVQCKYWKSSRVTEREVGEFYSAMMTNGAPRGIFVTAGSFSREAQQFAEGKGIDLMDRPALEECTAAVARAGENFCGITDWIEEFASHARIFDPECPICQGSMVIRNSRANGAAAWTCRNHPRCPGRREPRRNLVAVAAARRGADEKVILNAEIAETQRGEAVWSGRRIKSRKSLVLISKRGATFGPP